jgi:hypothetical protein
MADEIKADIVFVDDTTWNVQSTVEQIKQELEGVTTSHIPLIKGRQPKRGRGLAERQSHPRVQGARPVHAFRRLRVAGAGFGRAELT